MFDFVFLYEYVLEWMNRHKKDISFTSSKSIFTFDMISPLQQQDDIELQASIFMGFLNHVV